MHYSNNIAINS